ncbi:MAG: hypothetical protein AB8E87_13405 [Prochlorococcus sp.]
MIEPGSSAWQLADIHRLLFIWQHLDAGEAGVDLNTQSEHVILIRDLDAWACRPWLLKNVLGLHTWRLRRRSRCQRARRPHSAAGMASGFRLPAPPLSG